MSALSVPYYKQNTVYTCGPTSLQMVLAFYDVKDSEKHLAQLLDTQKNEGTSRVRMYELAVKLGFHCYVNDEASFAEIEFLLNLNIPPIVRFIEPDGEEDHYGVVVASTQNSLKIHDPWNGPEQEYNKDDFTSRWTCNSIGNCNQWLMAISPQALPLGHQFHPHG